MGQGTTRQYDPTNVVLNIGGTDIVGFAEGSFIEVERNKDAWLTVVGSDGEVTRIKNPDISGTFKVTMNQSSPSNDYLSTLATLDEHTSNGNRPVYLTDKNGTSKATAKTGWVRKKAKLGFSNANETREWVVETGAVVFDIGGQTELE